MRSYVALAGIEPALVYTYGIELPTESRAGSIPESRLCRALNAWHETRHGALPSAALNPAEDHCGTLPLPR
jgi:hypothetical protein